MPLHRPARARGLGLAAALAAATLTVSACAPAVTQGNLVGHSAPDANLHVKGVSTSSFDTFAQNALSDIMTFWTKNYPKVSGGKAFEPLQGGYYSVDGRQVALSGMATAPATENKCIAQENDAIIDNAFYCRVDDSIAWDRSDTHLLAKLAGKYGKLLVGLIFAHETGHSISNRLGIFDDDPPVIDTESQADCAAGAWAASALKGQDAHFTDADETTLDDALEGYLDARDGTPVDARDISHGDGFDRLSAIADGLDKGVTYCFSPGYFKSRTFTERPYYASEREQDNSPLSQIVDTSSGNVFVQDLNRFWKAAAAESSGKKTFTPVTIAEATHPPCAAADVRFGYCPDDNKVYFNSQFMKQTYYSIPGLTADRTTGDVTLLSNQPGDFAVGVLLSMGWGLAVRHQLFDRSTTGKDALISAICYSGSYAKDINIMPTTAPGAPLITLSPSDLDEAVSAMLNQVGTSAFSAEGTTGLDRIQSFVKGYKGGLGVC